MTDLAIVGGGPAGLATALFAARRGLSTVVLERRRLPLDKACGEGLMPAGVDALAELGVEIPASATHPFAGIQFRDGAHHAEARFRGRPGLGIRRTALIEAMAARAAKLGVDLRYGVAAQGVECDEQSVRLTTHEGSVEARFGVAADGLRSRLRRELDLEPRGGPGPVQRPRVGMRRHFRVAPWSAYVEVHWSNGLEAYVTPVGPELVGVALLGAPERVDFGQAWRLFPALAERLAGAAIEGSDLGAGPLRQPATRRQRGRMALVGDAAGYLDAISGEGLTLAFRSARVLAEIFADGSPLRQYEAEYRRLSTPYYRMTALLLALSSHPVARRGALHALARIPGLFDRLLAHHAGEW
jgi:flavin-dependent dehydrogenase